MIRVVLDSGALSAWARNDRRVLAALEAVRGASGHVIVPTVVVAESTTGDSGRDASVNQRLKGTVLDACDEVRARRAAALRYATGRASELSVVDAVVVATGEALAGRIITSDPGDLEALANVGERVDVVALQDLS